jgi:SAM-dependent methyltransferase
VAAYSSAFYDKFADTSLASGRATVPVVADWLSPTSVLDLGCGVGPWLAAWREFGVEDICGVDGDYVDRGRLMIPAEAFIVADLGSPIDLGRRFDLVMSVEVAEHIEPDRACTFVDNLIRHGDAVLFSAAIPGQYGTNHVNEQWPEYWIAHFEDRGYRMFDLLRGTLWDRADITPWYRQNCFLFAKGESAERLDKVPAPPRPFRVVHPEVFDLFCRQVPSIRQITRWAWPSAKRAISARLGSGRSRPPTP